MRPGFTLRGLCAALALLGAVLPRCPAAANDVQLRVELWNFYQSNEDDSGQDKLTFRMLQDVDFGSGWSVTFREDLPLILTDKTGPQNTDGEWTSGIGDAFVQAVVSTPEVLPRTTLQAGLRVVFPTGGEGPFGGSTYQLGPIAGISHRIDSVAGGLLLSPFARYLISVAETEADATPVRRLQIYPRAVLTLSERWQLAIYDGDQPILYDHKTAEWFVPFDALLSYEFARGATVKIGGAVHLTENTTQYRHVVYSALSFRF